MRILLTLPECFLHWSLRIKCNRERSDPQWNQISEPHPNAPYITGHVINMYNMFTYWGGLTFAGLSPETGGGRGPSPGTGTTNRRGLSHDQGGTDILR